MIDLWRAPRVTLWRGLGVAAVLLATATAVARFAPDRLDHELSRRLLGALLGAVVVVYANAIPKSVPPLGALRCGPTGGQELRRFSGWALVLGGAGYVLAWLFAPLPVANALAAGLLAAALAAVVVKGLVDATGRGNARRS